MEKNESTELARAIASQKSYVGPAVIVFLLYWLFWIPGIIFNLMWLGEARETKKITGVQPGGVGCLWFMLIIGLAPFIVFILLCLSIAGITASTPDPSPQIIPPSERTTQPVNQVNTVNPVTQTPAPSPTPIPVDRSAIRQQSFTTIKALGTIRQTLNRATAIEATANQLRNDAQRYLQIKFNNFPVTNPITNQTVTFSWERDGARAAEEINALAQQVETQSTTLREQATARLAQHNATIDNVNQKIEDLWNTIDPSGTTRTLYETAFATIINKEFQERTYTGDNPDDDIVFTIQTTNNSTLTIEALEGQWDIKDRLGNPLLLITGTTNGPIPPGQTLESNILLDYNPYDNDDQALKAATLNQLSITYHPRAILFNDGTTITRPIDRDWE